MELTQDVAGMSDHELIAASTRDPTKFREIFDRYFDQVHGYIARRVGPDHAEDITADTFLTAFKQRGRYRAQLDTARPWLYGIATNLLRRQVRSQRRFLAAMRRLDPAGSRPDEGPEDVVTNRVAAEGSRPALVTALAGLAPRDREVLLLRALADLDYDEIAQALGIPRGTVSSRLARARRKVRTALGNTDPENLKDCPWMI